MRTQAQAFKMTSIPSPEAEAADNEELRPEEEEEEDEAPDSVTFESSKAVALEAFKSESATRLGHPTHFSVE